ncbi:MAG: NAD-dependent protein deacetylase of SIR2 family [Firmicutes bacterium]|nr:NAD-dependent protein deacetylase of SIR2 family [Bacillota bacterium]
MQEIKSLSHWIKASGFTVILTGAGMSTESGLPDFRSKSGWWRNIDPSTVATVDALETNYSLFHDFYSMRLKTLEACSPHEGHYILAEWEKRNLVHSIVTQNVDGFHKAAGSSRVYELHGSLRSIRCSGCGKPGTVEDFLDRVACRSCGERLRPGVVLFGEMLPQDAWECALRDIKRADLVIVIGTSLQVYPANQLPTMTKGRAVLINYEAYSGGSRFDMVLQGKARDTLIELNRIIHKSKVS